MVSGGTVINDFNHLKTSLDNYSSNISNLSSGWKGPSYDGISSKTEAFVSEYSGTLSSQMNAFASACDLYQEYIQCKRSLISAESSYHQASQNNDYSAMSHYNNEISSYQAKLKELKSKIESLLNTASQGKLSATNIGGSSTPSASNTAPASTQAVPVETTSVVGQNPNYIYSTKHPGYVFPFEKGVHAPVNSHIGKRRAPTKGASSSHQGTDIGAAKGTEIHAIYSGKVITAKDFGGYGNCVRVLQDDGNLTYYAHCSKLTVKEGDRVEAGDIVGTVGSTGVATGPHLHLEIRASDYDKNKHLLDSEEIFEGVWPKT